MRLNGYSWVEGRVINATDPSGEQLQAPPIPWDEILEEIIRNANGTSVDWDAALREAIRRQGRFPTPQLMAQGFAHLGAAGIVVTTLVPVQQPNGLICNSWEHQLGLCHPVWDSLDTYQQLGAQTEVLPGIWWQPVDLGDSCLTMPLLQTQPQVPPYRNPPQEQTQVDENSYFIHIALGLAEFGSYYGTGELGLGAAALTKFTLNLHNRFLGTRLRPTRGARAGAVFDRMWYDRKWFPPNQQPLSSDYRFPSSFIQAISDSRVTGIHFNFEEIEETIALFNEVSDLREYIRLNGNGGNEYMGSVTKFNIEGREVTFITTAWELGQIVSPQHNPPCESVNFYERGTQDVTQPSEALKHRICSIRLS
ncbi:MAG: hypothetical protein OHK0046_12040 [Anaerolineae bacterium]